MFPSKYLHSLLWLTPTAKFCIAQAPAFFLAGDSTTAPLGGWGPAFIPSLTNGSIGTNFAASGRTTTSFRADGYWDQVLEAVAESAATHIPYVTIQFGHNDQKTDAGLEVFVDNLVEMDGEVRAAGGVPIFLTPLSRRNYDADGRITRDLANVVELTEQAAVETGALLGDLNARSMEYLEAIGEENAITYDYKEGDRTHINQAGEVVFAGVVALLLDELVPGLSEYIVTDEKLVKALEAGEYYYPE
ncbi:hypothetical protein FQN55_009037 [Onygenales sp. PD_40]|nr:hypothetical protein FQN55_009037 [Onygenales sp. PD_40]KAK2781621.1 hypothetical protein FQN52_001398 [Onygenales sp. PD_12]KAK2783957.1 hypothetical protein FQN53_008878 [Emmonsiellopsis sp. PD_33]